MLRMYSLHVTSSSVMRKCERKYDVDVSGSKLPGNKRVFMITDNDDPPGSSSNREPARTVYSVRRSKAPSGRLMIFRIC